MVLVQIFRELVHKMHLASLFSVIVSVTVLIDLCGPRKAWVPGLAGVFQNWPNNRTVEAEKIVQWETAFLQLFEVVDPLACFRDQLVNVIIPFKIVRKWNFLKCGTLCRAALLMVIGGITLLNKAKTVNYFWQEVIWQGCRTFYIRTVNKILNLESISIWEYLGWLSVRDYLSYYGTDIMSRCLFNRMRWNM